MSVHLIWLALACGGSTDGTGTDADDTAADPGPLEPALEVGTGDRVFEPLEDGDDIFIVQGPQGGFHFDGSIRVQGIETGDPGDLFSELNPTTVWRAFEGNDQIDVGIEATQGLDPVDGEPGVYETVGRKVILDITRDLQLAGDNVTLQVKITDVDGISLLDERTLNAVPHPLNE